MSTSDSDALAAKAHREGVSVSMDMYSAAADEYARAEQAERDLYAEYADALDAAREIKQALDLAVTATKGAGARLFGTLSALETDVMNASSSMVARGILD